jgi:hypothetical protein
LSSTNCHIEFDNNSGRYRVTVFGQYDTVDLPYWGVDGYLKGTIKVKGKKTVNGEERQSTVKGWTMQITWAAYGDLPSDIENLKDNNEDGKEDYKYGRPGTHSAVVWAAGWPSPQTVSFPISGEVADSAGASYKEYVEVEWNFSARWRTVS